MHDKATNDAAATDVRNETIQFEDKSVRYFMWASIIWGIVGMLAGVIAAFQMPFWEMNSLFLQKITSGLNALPGMGWVPVFDTTGIEYITFGRLRPLHTNAAIFAFVGNMVFAGVYYSTQRLCKQRTASSLLTWLHFWGWQTIIVLAALTIPAGFTRGKEYAELIWPINIMVAVVWVIFGWNFFWTLKRRNEPSLYVALWFYIATIVTVAMLYIVNHLSIPTSLTHSYPIFGGVQDALVQWWYGHNAVAFFLTTPVLGIMYYFMPKAAERPVYSYRLSIIHFWSLVFIYIWAGPHHLLNTGLPKWLQMIGMFFSLMLWAPSWGGMLNGLLTLRGAWDKLRTDPVIKFFVVGITFYGMSTFEGPLLSIRAVNALGHYTDWIVGHVHGGTLGWNGFMAAGMFYWLAPRLYGRALYSKAGANLHFWIGLVGILIYVGSMWAAGITQGLMLNGTKEGGTMLAQPDFVKTVGAIKGLYIARGVGGLLYLAGYFILVWNIFMTMKKGKTVEDVREYVVTRTENQDAMGFKVTFMNDPVVYFFVGLVFLLGMFFAPVGMNVACGLIFLVFVYFAVQKFKAAGLKWGEWYHRLLENYLPFTILTFIAVAIGGMVQIIPNVTINRAANIQDRLQVPYTPLELAGRDIYIAEGCYNCHSQQIRTMVPDVLRYGDHSRIGESIYDFPFQWGSKRTGPDLAREGGKRPNTWHYDHMLDPRDVVEDSIMPAYPWLFDQKTDYKALPKKVEVQQQLGVPMISDAIIDRARLQALEIAQDLQENGRNVDPDTKIIALIAYLQKLGAYEEVKAEEEERDLEQDLPDKTFFNTPDTTREDIKGYGL
ncbi:cytochrome-c oxidase, cbb3-type subunit I [Sulfuriroseicoccus oceanibius]|uniref:cytochrome-c oxidase n=1 Tax=Sulfuriroseicoccus oceanibius TaxID=2707525 RepID=A0A6B3LAM4_9BACT|nr:cytochrome-c oxidase, cbb3-type subunit I [Sulfuriroseicoccus oceanibius]QQL46079.1 cytochrome-c oxidase, cbb3-type subunit I [Sulfuriroseicoccus oceanibius]